MNILLKLRSISFSVLTAFAVVACGGGDDGSNMVAGGGVTGTGVSMGTVTGFGSVFVNGVKYNTDEATITLDDNPGSESDLRIGMVVKVEGSINDGGTTGTAVTISYNDILEGTVDTTPDLATNTFVAMGQTIKFDNLTVFEDKTVAPTTIGTFVASAGDIGVGNVIEVSGWLDDSGVVRASRIERKALTFVDNGTNELEIKGKIANLNEVDKTFTIGGLTVDYNTAVMLEGVLVNGGLVEVKSTQALTAGPTMIASQVEREALPFEGVVSGWAEVEGYVTALATSTADFTLLGMPVKTSNATVYENGVAGDIALGGKLKVKGVVGSDGVLVASLVVFKLPNNIKIEAVVDADGVDPVASTVTVLGITVHVNSTTQMEDDRDDLQSFSLTDLNPGDFVEIRGYLQGGDVIVSRLERDDHDEDAILQGPVSAKAGDLSSLTILGVTVNTSPVIIYRLFGGSGTTQTEFYDEVTSNVTIVKAKDKDFSGTNFSADEVQIESPD